MSILGKESLSGPSILEEDDQISLFPIKRQSIWDMYKQQVASFWTAEEIDLSTDKREFDKLSKDERHFIKNVLTFFLNSDVLVAENLVSNFCEEIGAPEAKMFYAFQTAMENIHTETYSLLIEEYIKDKDEKQQLLNSTQTLPCVHNKSKWARKYMDKDTCSFATRLIAFAVYEGVFFSGSFCAIFWLKKRSDITMHGLTFSNELISRDEGLHTSFACLLYRDYVEKEFKLPEEDVHAIVKDAIEVEREFITESLPVNLIGMNSAQMIEYIKFCADRLCLDLGVSKIYNVKNPFEWMEMISIDGKTNFFERRVGEYSKAGVGEKDNFKFSLEEDF